MEILLARSAGFCFGVKRAMQMAFEAAEEHSPIASLGPLIHSPQMVQKLSEKGVRVADEPSEISSGAAIVRSHGITAGELRELSGRGLTLVDATCPFVTKAQDHARELSNQGYFLVVVGEEQHPEVKGIVSYAESGVVVIATADEVEALPRRSKIGVIAQTTQSVENFSQVVEACLLKANEVRIFNTICDATTVRQEEARRIASKADLVLVVGGFNSANTTRLAKICKKIQPRTHQVETEDQIDVSWFKNVETVGVTAGASTPDWIIQNIIEKVETLDK